MPQPHSSRKILEILFEDDFYVVVNKPSGLVVVPTPHKEEKTITSLINAHYDGDRKGRLHPCHRLDRDTSGVMVFARGKKNQQVFMDEFKKRAVKKEYIAFVHGHMKDNAGRIEGAVISFDKKKYHQRPEGKWAATEYRVLVRMKNFTVVQVLILTGRSNQIRIHLAEFGHPLLGERKYAFAKDYNLKFRRTALHAKSIQFRHPVTGEIMTVESVLPEDMASLWQGQRGLPAKE